MIMSTLTPYTKIYIHLLNDTVFDISDLFLQERETMVHVLCLVMGITLAR